MTSELNKAGLEAAWEAYIALVMTDMSDAGPSGDARVHTIIRAYLSASHQPAQPTEADKLEAVARAIAAACGVIPDTLCRVDLSDYTEADHIDDNGQRYMYAWRRYTREAEAAIRAYLSASHQPTRPAEAEVERLRSELVRAETTIGELLDLEKAAWSKHGGMEMALGQWEHRAATAESSLASAQRHIEALQAKVGANSCGCAYDNPDDVCDHHSPKLVAARQQIDALKKSLATVTYYEPWMDNHADNVEVSTFKRHTFGELRSARAALRERE